MIKHLVKDITCTCGGNVSVKIPQPKRFQPTVARSRCSQCESLYQFRCFVRPGSNTFEADIDIDLIETTPFLQNEFDAIKIEKLKELGVA